MAPPPTDWRALCAELIKALNEMVSSYNVPNQSALIESALGILAQPEPEGLTDEELDKVLFQAVNAYMETRGPFDGPVDHLRLDRAKARAAIAADRARWRRHLPTQPTTTP